MTDVAPSMLAGSAAEAQLRHDQQPQRHSRARTRLAATKYKTLATGKSPFKITVTPAAQTVAHFPSQQQQENVYNQSNEASSNATHLASPPPAGAAAPHNRHKRAVSTMLSSNNSSAAAPTISSMYRQQRSPLTQLRSPPLVRNNNNHSSNASSNNHNTTHTVKRTRRHDTTISLLWQTLESKLIEQMKLFYGTYFMSLLKPQMLGSSTQQAAVDTDALEARMTEFEVLVQVTSRSIRRLQQLCNTPVNTAVPEADDAMKAIYKAYKTTRHAKKPAAPSDIAEPTEGTAVKAEPAAASADTNSKPRQHRASMIQMTSSPSATALQSVVEEDLVYTDENVEESCVRFGTDGDDESDEHLEMHDNGEDHEMLDVVTPLKPHHTSKHHQSIQNQFGSPSSEHVVRASLQHIVEEHEEVDMSAVMKRFRHARIAAKMKHQGRAFSTWQAATDDDTEQLIAEVIERQSLANQRSLRNSLAQYVSPSRERSMANQMSPTQPSRGSLVFSSVAAARISTLPHNTVTSTNTTHSDLYTQSQLALLATTAMKLHHQWRLLGRHTMQRHAFAAIVSTRTQSSTILIPSGRFVRLLDAHLQWSTSSTFVESHYDQQLDVRSITQIDTSSAAEHPTQLTIHSNSVALHSESYAEIHLLFDHECEMKVFVELLRMALPSGTT